MAQVIKRADAWRDTQTERSFSMALGRLGDPADGDCLLVEAVQNHEPSWRCCHWCPGATAASPGSDAALATIPQRHIELMVTELTSSPKALALTAFLLRDVPLGVRAGRTARRRPGGRSCGADLLVFFSRWWQLETLYRSNMKYQPEWVPRFACYEDAG